MKPLDLASLEHVHPQSDGFHRTFFDGLMQKNWAFESLTIPENQFATLSSLITDWIRQAPLADSFDEMRLLASRNGIRRLSNAMGTTLSELVKSALAWNGADIRQLSERARHKLALMADAELVSGADLLNWSLSEPRLAMLFAINALDDSPVSATRLQALNQITEQLPQLPLTNFPPSFLTLLYRVSFKLSYLTGPARYQAKRKIIDQAQTILQQLNIKPMQPTPSSSDGMPHLLVIGDGFMPGHAMYRFFASQLQELRQHFRVSLMTDAREQHPAQAELADHVCYLGASAQPVEHWSEQIQQLKPDIIFYPNIGMSFATFTLSLLRLAPLQVGSIGHPAVSYSPHIDATLLFNAIEAPADLPHPLRYNSHQLRPALADWHAPLKQQHHDALPVCIGINGSMIKLNAAFLHTVETVLRAIAQPYRLCFFPNVAGLDFQGLCRQLVQQFPNAEIFASGTHADYSEKLAQCDLVLQTFPYGGANTTSDALNSGIPVVALRSAYLSGQTDMLLLGERGLADLCVDSEADYIELAVRLLTHPEQLKLHRQLLTETRECKGKQIEGNRSAADALFEFWQTQSRLHAATS